ncbi:MAG: ferredoxin [Acidimicrobiia bacterium]
MKVTVDAAACTGHGRCYSLAPEVFEPDDDGHSVVIAADVPEHLRDQARTAAANCPESAITVDD